MQTIRTLLILITLLSMTTASGGNEPQFATPDFGYPQTVADNARKVLAQPDASGLARLRALEELTSALTMIDRDTVFDLPAIVAQQAANPGLSKADKAMLTAYELKIYSYIFNRNSWKYSQVDAPDKPVPADIRLWSDRQFFAKIDSLYRIAISEADSTPLTAYAQALTYSDAILPYIPDVAGFVRYLAMDALKAFRQFDAKEFIQSAIDSTSPDSAPRLYWECALAKKADTYNLGLSQLQQIYSRNSDKAFAAYALYEYSEYAELWDMGDSIFEEAKKNSDDTLKLAKQIAAEIRKMLAFGNVYNKEGLENNLKLIEQATVSLEVPNLCYPGESIRINWGQYAAKSVTIHLYRLRNNSPVYNPSELRANGSLVASYPLPVEGECQISTLDIPIPTAGNYQLLTVIDKTTEEVGKKISATYYLPVLIDLPGAAHMAAMDYRNGAPVANVTTYCKTNRQTKRLGTTDHNGLLKINENALGDYNNTLITSYKGAEFQSGLYMYHRYSSDAKKAHADYNMCIFTDRSLYHPGDTIRWALVAALKDSRGTAVAEAHKVTVRLLDANRQEVETIDVVTDAFGRAKGEFVTRKSTLTGSWTVSANLKGSVWTASVTVSDFRIPTFKAEFTSIELNTPDKGDVRLHGKATTYSGMPVSGASVNIELSGTYMWRWFGSNTQLGKFDAVTDTDGSFTVTIPDSTLTQTDGDRPFAGYVAGACVTARDGAIAEADKFFSLGKSYSLSSNARTTYNTSQPVNITVNASNADGDMRPLALTWQLQTSADKVVASGKCKGGDNIAIDASAFDAGTYKLTVAAADSSLANSLTQNLMLYNTELNRVPDTGEAFFIPVQSVVCDDNGRCQIHIGTNSDDARILIAAGRGKELTELTNLPLKRGFQLVSVNTGTSDAQARIIVIGIADGKICEKEIVVRPAKTVTTEIVAESFRDRLVPQSGEQWRFRLVSDGTAVPAAMIATMYNKALDQLAQGVWPSGIGFLQAYCPLNARYTSLWTSESTSKVKIDWLRTPDIQWPEYRYFDNLQSRYNFAVTGYVSRRRMTMSSADGSANMEYAKVEAAEAAEEEEEELVEDLAAPKLYGARAATMDIETIASGVMAENGAAPKMDYRPAEVLQAFWMPSLTSDADGNIDLRFTVPNSNGTWQLHATAWTHSARFATYAAECLANKPVMVQPMLPRFLRQGDKARVLATVYNNSDADAAVCTTIEAFDITDGHIISTVSSTDTIAAGASAMVGADIAAATDASAVGYRVRSVMGGFADGEQALIPVLASEATVIESTEFYVNPNQSQPVEISVKPSADATVTLQYCQNPIWTVVKAMRGIAAGESITANGTVSRLFSALAARHIIGTNPAIAEAIKNWRDNPSEEAMTSMLEKNAELKSLLLDQTPWVQAAADNSTRMAALATLLDPARSDAAIAQGAKALKDRQTPLGGFRWGSWSNEPSVWTTENVMTTLGIANSLGLIRPTDKELLSLLRPAFNYLQAEAVKPKRPATDRTLAFIASCFKGMSVSTPAKALIERTRADIAANWRRDDLCGKAYDILILQRASDAAAADIYASVRQFGVVKAGMGMCFPSVTDIRAYATILQAYRAMDAPAADIDAMRQWITVRAQATDDLGACNPDYVIAAMLTTGTDWTAVPVSESVSVDGRSIAIDKVESATGYFTTRLKPTGKKMTITVRPNGVTPSYGSIVTIDRLPMTKVKAHDGRNIKISRRFLVERDGGWVETETFTLGERVRVQLTVIAGRDMEYVAIDDRRAAALEPVDQLPGYVWDGGLGFYRENLDSSTRLFISYLPKGSYHITYDMTAAIAGSFVSGTAAIQSQYAPELTAHSAGAVIEVQ